MFILISIKIRYLILILISIGNPPNVFRTQLLLSEFGILKVRLWKPTLRKSRPMIMAYFYERSIIATLRCLKQSYLFYLCWTCERSETWGGRCFVFPSFIRLRGLFFQVSISKAKRTKYKSRLSFTFKFIFGFEIVL